MFKLIFLMSLHNINPPLFVHISLHNETFFQTSVAKKEKCFWTDVETEECQFRTFQKSFSNQKEQHGISFWLK